jgi:hypothetical protein
MLAPGRERGAVSRDSLACRMQQRVTRHELRIRAPAFPGSQDSISSCMFGTVDIYIPNLLDVLKLAVDALRDGGYPATPRGQPSADRSSSLSVLQSLQQAARPFS